MRSGGWAIIESVRYLRTDGSGSAPVTTLVAETAGLTVTNPGDPATAGVLRRRRPEGERKHHHDRRCHVGALAGDAR
jgi:hypothetical protein